MKLIQDIKKAEEEGEALKKNAEIEGQKLIEQTRDKGEKEFASLDAIREHSVEKELARAHKVIEDEMRKLDAEQAKNIKKINEMYENNKEKAVKAIQNLILKWPSSR
jgi:hypothetical protein